jgi:hypothetical protein
MRRSTSALARMGLLSGRTRMPRNIVWCASGAFDALSVEAFVHRYEQLDADALASQLHLSPSTAVATLRKLKSDRKIFSFLYRGRESFPAFQFDALTGAPRPVIRQVLETFGGRFDGWEIAFWFARPNGLLPRSARPLRLLICKPKAVIEAACEAVAKIPANEVQACTSEPIGRTAVIRY